MAMSCVKRLDALIFKFSFSLETLQKGPIKTSQWWALDWVKRLGDLI